MVSVATGIRAAASQQPTVVSRVVQRILFIAAVATFQLAAPPALQAQTPQRLALVIGNDSYANAPLKNARNDAHVVETALTQLGFQVDLVTDVNRASLERSIDRFLARLQSGTIALVFYAGHGVQIEGDNYLLPIDFKAQDEADAKFQGYSATRLHDRVAARGVRLQILILDACRDNPFRSSRSTTRGLVAMSSPHRGSLIQFSTAPGEVAADNPDSANSTFTAQLVEAMLQPGVSLETLFLQVRQSVARMTQNRQIPWTTTSLLEQFYFSSPPPNLDQAAELEELLSWRSANSTDVPELVESHLRRYPNGRYAAVARTKLLALRELAPGGGRPSTSRTRRDTVAVELFDNVTRRADVDWIGTALTKSLITDLAVGDRLRVISPALNETPTQPVTNGLPRISGPTRSAVEPQADYTITGSYIAQDVGGQLSIRVNTTVLRRGEQQPIGAVGDTVTEQSFLDFIARHNHRVTELLGVSTSQISASQSIALPSTPDATRWYAEAIEQMRRFDASGASETLTRLTSREPEFPFGFSKLSEALAALGFDAKALEAATKARELADRLTREQRLTVDARTYAVNAQWNEAVTVWRVLVSLYPDELEYRFRLAEAQIRSSDARGALATIAALRKSEPVGEPGREIGPHGSVCLSRCVRVRQGPSLR